MNSDITEILIATGNPGKLAEFEKLLAPIGIRILSVKDFPELPDPIEDGATLEANALIKAKSAYEHSGILSLSDDTGLEVDALSGAPGVLSARYSDPGATPEKNVQKLLSELSGIQNRKARFRTVLALYPLGGHPKYFEGICTGIITEQTTGKQGFGYDPIFRPEGYNITFAEMSSEEKNQISHRGRAMATFKKWLLTPP